MALNTKQPGDCGYIGFYKRVKYEVYAKSSYSAQQIIAKHVKAKKSYDVVVLIAEREDGSEVIHTATF